MFHGSFKTTMPPKAVMIASASHTPWPPDGTHSQWTRKQWIILDYFLYIGSIITHYTSWILPSHMLVASTSTSVLFSHLSLSHCHLLPGPIHSPPMTVVFSVSSAWIHSGAAHRILEQNPVQTWTVTVTDALPSVVCKMVLIWSHLLKWKATMILLQLKF